ncbi:hypothetical protein L3i22_011390 [Actinoplanes sp. L3-i22]|nr:hypothetical protein L3i22_011390 [Actinoplanes sp. L3-i22]
MQQQDGEDRALLGRPEVDGPGAGEGPQGAEEFEPGVGFHHGAPPRDLLLQWNGSGTAAGSSITAAGPQPHSGGFVSSMKSVGDHSLERHCND